MKIAPQLSATLLLTLTATWLATPAAAHRQDAAPAAGEAGWRPDWPVELSAGDARIVLYQPQLESFNDHTLTARAAVGVTPGGADEPVFGAVWFDCRVATDRDDREVRLLDVQVSDSRFPDATDEQLMRLAGLLEREIESWSLVMSLDDLLAQLDVLEQQRRVAESLNNEPPTILVVDHPAVLIQLDGEPRLEPVDETTFMRVINTPYFMLLDTSTRTYLLADGQSWFSAKDIGGPWSAEPAPPEKARELAGADLPQASEEDQAELQPERMPQVIVVNEPTELIVTDGKANYTPIEGTGLLFIANSESDLFMEIDTQRFFLLLSGRWFGAPSLKGSWSFVPAEDLPADFAKIPPGSPKADVLASVPETQQAIDAVHDAYIPQTAAIDRETATTEVEYDGEPKFEVIEGTHMTYAVNTPSSVIKVGDRYYCCDQGVWFVSTRPDGPWIVATSVPDEIYTIPASSPVYNVRYVYVYDYTPTVVYVGYTPGYTGCYVYRGTVVYGTGYYYRGWYRRYYYPRPCTYGFSFRYNSYTGSWGVRVGWGYGGWYGGFAYRSYGGRAGWWGPGGCRYIDEINTSRTITTPRGTFQSYGRIERDGNELNFERSSSWTPNENIYERRDNAQRNIEDRREERRAEREERRGEAGDRGGDRADRRGEPGDRGGDRADRARTADATGRRNDLFADRDGNVMRRGADGSWEQRTGDGWTRTQDRTAGGDRPGRTTGGAARPTTGERRPTTADRSRPTTGSRPSGGRSQDLNRHYDARQHGNQRTRSYRGSPSGRSSAGRSRPSGGRGGGRRR